MREMDAGAWGMSSGLIYVPSRYADTEELIALAKVVADRGGFYASHIRDEEDGLLGSIDEAIRIGREAKLHVHISHLKANLKDNWGKVEAATKAIEAAIKQRQAVTADQYPYVASSTRLSAMVVPEWARRGDEAEFSKLADDPVKGPELRKFIDRELKRRNEGRAIRIAAIRRRFQAQRFGCQGDRRTIQDDSSRRRPQHHEARRCAGDPFRHVGVGRPVRHEASIRRDCVRRGGGRHRESRSTASARIRNVSAKDSLRA